MAVPGPCCWRIDLAALARDCLDRDCARWPASEWLDAQELDRLQSFALNKRRIEWLGGRLAAKRALGQLYAREGWAGRAPRACRVVHHADGRPVFDGMPLHLSISHSRQLAMAAVGTEPLGVDVESVDALRADSLVALLRPAEVRVLRQAMGLRTDSARALAWCLKEALFKVVGAGGFARFASALHLAGWQPPDRPQWQAHALEEEFAVRLAREANRWRAWCAVEAGMAHVLVLPA
ncbi:hypothetical protein BKK81_22690 [Cupriavidus sp. USMAHM13]|nr:hypothetical protein BKK81_22690 [Cupriavidus sp. USMAHM13]